ncbi:MAG: hypothetical protein HZC48_02545 [Nitrospirae bacterium]|nr:hypothetical protein [Nitrospirota bacterium]
MRKRQKLLLTIYALVILILIFAYTPIICHYESGINQYTGHHLRANAKKLTFQHSFKSYKFCTVDSFLLFNEILGITLVTGTLFLLLNKRRTINSE